MTANVLERTREIGILRCIGAHRRDIRRIFESEGLAVSVLGWLIGIPVGYLIFRLFLKAVSNIMNLDLVATFPLDERRHRIRRDHRASHAGHDLAATPSDPIPPRRRASIPVEGWTMTTHTDISTRIAGARVPSGSDCTARTSAIVRACEHCGTRDRGVACRERRVDRGWALPRSRCRGSTAGRGRLHGLVWAFLATGRLGRTFINCCIGIAALVVCPRRGWPACRDERHQPHGRLGSRLRAGRDSPACPGFLVRAERSPAADATARDPGNPRRLPVGRAASLQCGDHHECSATHDPARVQLRIRRCPRRVIPRKRRRASLSMVHSRRLRRRGHRHARLARPRDRANCPTSGSLPTTGSGCWPSMRAAMARVAAKPTRLAGMATATSPEQCASSTRRVSKPVASAALASRWEPRNCSARKPTAYHWPQSSPTAPERRPRETRASNRAAGMLRSSSQSAG